MQRYSYTQIKEGVGWVGRHLKVTPSTCFAAMLTRIIRLCGSAPWDWGFSVSKAQPTPVKPSSGSCWPRKRLSLLLSLSLHLESSCCSQHVSPPGIPLGTCWGSEVKQSRADSREAIVTWCSELPLEMRANPHRERDTVYLTFTRERPRLVPVGT